MSIVIEQLVKRYQGHPVVNDVSLDVPEGEFFVLLGPSGSGKSTLLRLIAGLTEADSGRVRLHGRDVTDLAPQKRDIGFVFQSYALFRHMSVAGNIEFPLVVRRVRRAERRRRCDELLELVGLAGLGGRLPEQLSGGQQQRVALARALAHRPELLLLDEPFGALDARIRADLRRTVRAIQRELRVTALFVTHDQEEAFELADRIGVMDHGRLLETGQPQELYLRPQTEFVATFLGTANLMVGECGPEGVRLGPIRVPLGTEAAAAGEGTRRVQVLFRPEDVAVKTTPEALGWPLLGEAVVEACGFLGSYERMRLRLPPLAGVRPIAPQPPFGQDSVLLEASRSQHQARRYPLRPGDTAWIGVRRVHALTHPGLSLLLLTDGSPESRGALEMGARIGRMAHGRLALLGYEWEQDPGGRRLQEARERIVPVGALIDARSTPDALSEAVSTEVARYARDLVVHVLPAEGRAELVERLLNTGDHHVLLLPAVPDAGARPLPAHALISVAVGEPAKEDVLFAGRLLRHLGASATILTVLPPEHDSVEERQAERFMAASARTLARLGVAATTTVRTGNVLAEVQAERARASNDLLVLGAPLPDRRGRVSLAGLAASLLDEAAAGPVLVVRTRMQEAAWN